MTQPTSGGTYSRNPKTGELTLVTPATAWEAAEDAPAEPAATGEIEPTETPAAPVKRGK